MFRRLSILVRRTTDERETFARAWKHHGTLVKHLPGVLSYLQNSIAEEFGHSGGLPPFDADGVVELRFESPEAMAAAFASEEARPVKSDEPNFLGHGTGYIVAVAQEPRAADREYKLIIVARIDKAAGRSSPLESVARSQRGLTHVMRDDVVDVIARPEMQRGPQLADVFLHLYFDTNQACRDAGRAMAALEIPGVAFSVFRATTLCVV